jgi:hypothetical protein
VPDCSKQANLIQWRGSYGTSRTTHNRHSLPPCPESNRQKGRPRVVRLAVLPPGEGGLAGPGPARSEGGRAARDSCLGTTHGRHSLPRALRVSKGHRRTTQTDVEGNPMSTHDRHSLPRALRVSKGHRRTTQTDVEGNPMSTQSLHGHPPVGGPYGPISRHPRSRWCMAADAGD